MKTPRAGELPIISTGERTPSPLPIPAATLKRICSFRNGPQANLDGSLRHPQREGRVHGVRQELLKRISKLPPGESVILTTEDEGMILNIKLAVRVGVNIEYSDGVAKITRT